MSISTTELLNKSYRFIIILSNERTKTSVKYMHIVHITKLNIF